MHGVLAFWKHGKNPGQRGAIRECTCAIARAFGVSTLLHQHFLG